MRISTISSQNKKNNPNFGKVYISPFTRYLENPRLKANFAKSEFYKYLQELDENHEIGTLLVDSNSYASEGSFFDTIRVQFLNDCFRREHENLNTKNFYRGFNCELDVYASEPYEALTDYILSGKIVEDLSKCVEERLSKIKENRDKITKEIVNQLIERRKNKNS